MKRTVLLAALLAAAPAFAGEGDVDIVPNGYVSQVMQAAQADRRAPAAAATKTRAQVAAETREAIRLGLLAHGEAGPVEITQEQASLIRRAGLRALAHEAGR